MTSNYKNWMYPRSFLCKEAKIKQRTSLKKELCEIGEESIWKSRFTSFFLSFFFMFGESFEKGKMGSHSHTLIQLLCLMQFELLFDIFPSQQYTFDSGETLYASCTVYKNDSRRSYWLLATLAGYMVVSLTLITTAWADRAFRSERQLLDAAGAVRGCNIARPLIFIPGYEIAWPQLNVALVCSAAVDRKVYFALDSMDGGHVRNIPLRRETQLSSNLLGSVF